MEPGKAEEIRTEDSSRSGSGSWVTSEEAAGSSPEAKDEPRESIDFVTLGMFIIGQHVFIRFIILHFIHKLTLTPDEIEYLPPRPPARDILGGAGSYSALGARLFSPPPLSKSSAG